MDYDKLNSVSLTISDCLMMALDGFRGGDCDAELPFICQTSQLKQEGMLILSLHVSEKGQKVCLFCLYTLVRKGRRYACSISTR